MKFLEQLKEYLLETDGMEANPSEIRWSPSGVGILYVDIICPKCGRGRIRCKFQQGINSQKLVSVQPMLRMTESQFPWDSTIKSVYSLYSGISGVNGVAHRTVNNSLI
jgi:hypothetical protein